MNFCTRSTIHGMNTAISFLLGATLLSLLPVSGSAATLPTLPQTYIDTTYSAPTGATCTAANSSAFQTCLNNAALNSTIVLQAGTTYSGNFTLPNKTTGSGWIYIVSSNLASLPAAGTRVSPSNAANMPKIVTPNNNPAITTASNAHHYRFVGIEFGTTSGTFTYFVLRLGTGENSVSLLPSNITIDRCYIHGDPTAGSRRGVSMDGISIAVIDSYVSDFKESGADSQAVWAFNTPGPIKIVNNYLEGAGENILFGGSDSPITNLVPSDIEIRRNYIFKPLSWIGSSWSIKNLLELKNAQRVLIEGNILENCPAASQSGFGVVLTPRNQSGTNPWATVRDVTVRLNKMINFGQGVNILGRDTVSEITRRVLVENNFIQVTRLNGADGRILQILGGPVDTTFQHNTALITTAGGAMGFTESSPDADQFVYSNNILSPGYGFIGTGTATCLTTLNYWYTNWTWTKNVVIGSAPPPGNDPPGNFYSGNIAGVGFVDYAGGNYRLTSSSPYHNAGTDGKDIGADINAIEAAIDGSIGGTISVPTNLRIN